MAPRIVTVSEWEARKMLRESNLPEMIRDGRLTPRIVRDGHPSRPKAREPFCTRSQFVAYHDRMGVKVLEVHRYLRTDGTLGASRQEDPKRILLGGILYQVGA